MINDLPINNGEGGEFDVADGVGLEAVIGVEGVFLVLAPTTTGELAAALLAVLPDVSLITGATVVVPELPASTVEVAEGVGDDMFVIDG